MKFRWHVEARAEADATAAFYNEKQSGLSQHFLTDLVSLVRYAIHQDNELIPFPERVNANFKSWLASHATVGAGEARERVFTEEQIHCLKMIRDHIAANTGIDTGDFEYAPFAQEGGLGNVHQLFGDKLGSLIDEPNEILAA